MINSKMEYPKELQKVINDKQIELVEPRRSLFIGVLFFLGFTFVPIVIILFSNWESWSKILVSSGLTIILFFVLYWNNIVRLDEVYLGVPKLFGKRQTKWLFEEGYHWMLPKPIMDIHPIYVGQQNLNIAHQVIPKKDIVLVNIDVSIFWQVVDPFKMTTAQRILNEIDNTGFIKAIQANLRTFAVDSEYDIKSLMTVGNQYGQGVTKLINDFVQSSREDWGIKVLDISMTKLVTVNPETMAKFERILQESLDRESKLIDTNTLADRIKIIIDKAGIPGDIAADFLLGLRGIIQRKESKFMGDIPALASAIELLLKKFL